MRARCLIACALVTAAAFAGQVSAETVAVDLTVRGGKLVAGPNLIKLKRDDSLLLSIVSDRPDDLHVHGYELGLKLQPNKRATLQFVVRRTGRFGIELHQSGLELGVLEIYPK